MTGVKAYLPAFWTLPSEFMSEAAAAASIGLINSFGNLGGAVGPSVVGIVRDSTGSYSAGLRFLATSMVISAIIIIALGIGREVETKAEPGKLNERNINISLCLYHPPIACLRYPWSRDASTHLDSTCVASLRRAHVLERQAARLIAAGSP